MINGGVEMLAKRAAVLMVIITFIFLSPVFAANGGDVVKIGFYPLPGLHNVSKSGVLSGYTYDYLQEIARITGWKYEYYVGDFADCLAKVKSGELDLIGGMQKTKERLEIFDFTEHACGQLCIELLVKSGNTKYAYEDTEAFNGMTVGVIRNLAANKDFEKYCRDNNFSVNIKEYGGNPDLVRAVENGEIDAFISLSSLPRKELSCIATFGYKGFYFMSTKGKTELMQKLNDAIEKIKMQKPLYEQELRARHLPPQKNLRPVFTREELEYIKKSGTLTVICNKNLKPLEFYNEDTFNFDGIIADVFALISGLSGLKFNYVYEENHEKACRLLINHDAHMKAGAPNDYIWAVENRLRISDEYLSVPAVMISSKRKEHNKTIVAMPESLHFFQKIAEGFPNYEYKKYATYEECFEAIFKGEADATFANTYLANEFLKKTKYSNMNILAMGDYFSSYCIAFPEDADRILMAIIDKTLACISREQINEIVIANTMTYLPVTFTDFIYRNPEASILLFCGIFGAFIYLVLNLHNKTRLARTLYDIVNVDELTGELSYAKFCRDANELLQEANRPQYMIAYVNIAKFKDINSLYGHKMGDMVLKSVSNLIKKSLVPGELFARQYADHFAALLLCPDLQHIKERHNELLEVVLSSFSSDEFTCKLRFRTGVYFLTDEDNDIVLCTDRARYAHYQCTSGVEQNYVVYNDALKQKIKTEHVLEALMEDALSDGEFKVYYQPKFDSRTGAIEGAEALIRWENPEHGMMAPSVFLPLFERNTFILKIDYYVFKEVCKFIDERKKAGKTVYPISCNFSRMHSFDEAFADRLVETADSFNVDHNMVILEITESVAMNDIDKVKIQFNKLREKGFIISIDDFGSGYSSLGILSEIEFDEIKLDRALIVNAVASESSRILLCGIVSMIHSLNRRIVCEGVEELAQVELLQSIGCYNVQGYFYSKPVSQQDFNERL